MLGFKKMIDKTMCEVLWRNISDNIIIVQDRYITIEKKIVVRIGYNGFLSPHDYSCEGRDARPEYSSQVILAMYFFILDKNNERPDWMTDLKHTDSAW
jgi:hypothetical protein